MKHAKIVRPDWNGVAYPGRITAAVTFDDGYRSVLSVALPELRRRGIPFAIFCISSRLGQPAPWAGTRGFEEGDPFASEQEICTLAAEGILIGAHTLTHPRLPELGMPEQWEQVNRCRQELQATVRSNVDMFAFPHGALNDELLAFCRRAGYLRVFTVEPCDAFGSVNEFVTGRVVADPDDWDIEFLLKLHGGYFWLSSVFAIRDCIGRAFGRRSQITVSRSGRERRIEKVEGMAQ